MTVADLKMKLSEYDDNLQIGGIGHYGEILEIFDVYKNERSNFIVIDIESAGQEPD